MALLIDADIVAYTAVSKAQQEVEFEPDVWQIYCDLKDVRRSFADHVQTLLEESKQDRYTLCFSDPSGVNFRKQLNPEYKATRSARKPVGYRQFVGSILGSLEAVYSPRLEADDVIGIMMSQEPGKHVVWSIDKDLKQIPGTHLVDGELVSIDELDADLSFFTQVLTGDTTDNYPGCPGIGPVKAAKILATAGDDAWGAILNAYACAGLTEADALLQARMAFLLRTENFNPDTGKIKLWKPN